MSVWIRFKTKEEIDADLERAAERKVRSCPKVHIQSSLLICEQAAVDQQKSDLAGTEVAHAMAVAAEHRASEENSTSVHTGRTAEDVQHDLDLAAERKKRIDDERAAKAGADYKHVRMLKHNAGGIAD